MNLDTIVIIINALFLIVSILILFATMNSPEKTKLKVLMCVVGVGTLILNMGKEITWGGLAGIYLVYLSLIKHRHNNGLERKSRNSS